MASRTLSRSRSASRFRFIPEGKIARKEMMWFYFFISPWIIGFLDLHGWAYPLLALP